MLEGCKSEYFIKVIFSHINDGRSLNILKFNKSLQNKLNINIVNYKIFSGKYITYETNDQGKIYSLFNNNIVFKGEFVKGQKNGKGKEYFEDGQLLFEG